ncbi:hypothetical protein TRVL_03351 [Trypanosoma vivax]|nr:hypothetical protein TRVL_03351 [Trypanosoma vivax]
MHVYWPSVTHHSWHTLLSHTVSRSDALPLKTVCLRKHALQMCRIPASSGAKLIATCNSVLLSVLYIARCFHPLIHLFYAVSSENCRHKILVSCSTPLYHLRDPLLERTLDLHIFMRTGGEKIVQSSTSLLD